MATLSQVYTTLGIGAGVTVGCYLVFGAAVRYEGNKDLTPRAWSRPRAVLKNVLSPPYCVSWMTWSLSQRYVDLLAGIPGTGTRLNGWSGPTLRTNLYVCIYIYMCVYICVYIIVFELLFGSLMDGF